MRADEPCEDMVTRGGNGDEILQLNVLAASPSWLDSLLLIAAVGEPYAVLVLVWVIEKIKVVARVGGSYSYAYTYDENMCRFYQGAPEHIARMLSADADASVTV